MEIVAVVLLIVVVTFVYRSLKVVPQQHAWVVEQIGRAHV